MLGIVIKTKKTEAELFELYKVRQNDRKRYRNQRKKVRKTTPQKASDLLRLFFKEDPLALRKMLESQALQAWPRYVGAEAAAVSQAIRIKEQELLIWVSDPLWLHQLLHLKNQILSCYRRDFPQLRLNKLYLKRTHLPGNS
ncbi:DUF721 domain-containing protein [bacterium]|nr:DUF721 domain-containing protein [bacterium]